MKILRILAAILITFSLLQAPAHASWKDKFKKVVKKGKKIVKKGKKILKTGKKIKKKIVKKIIKKGEKLIPKKVSDLGKKIEKKVKKGLKILLTPLYAGAFVILEPIINKA